MQTLTRLRTRFAVPVTLLLVAVALALTVYVVVTNANERSASILRDCQQQNIRHDRTIKALDRVLAKAEAHAPSAAQRRQVVASRAPTVLLINALAPKQDCPHVVAKATHP